MTAKKSTVTVFETEGYSFSLEEWFDIYQTADDAGLKHIRIDQTRETKGVGDDMSQYTKTTVKIESVL